MTTFKHLKEAIHATDIEKLRHLVGQLDLNNTKDRAMVKKAFEYVCYEHGSTLQVEADTRGDRDAYSTLLMPGIDLLLDFIIETEEQYKKTQNRKRPPLFSAFNVIYDMKVRENHEMVALLSTKFGVDSAKIRI